MGKFSKKFLLVVLFFLVLISTVGYSALATSLSITSDIIIRPITDIRVTGIRLHEVKNNGKIEYESKYTVDRITNGFSLPNTSSEITYKVTVENFGNIDQTIYGISTTSNNPNLTYTITGYEEKEIIEFGTSIEFYITYKTTSGYNDVINAITTFDFRKVYRINYDTDGGTSVSNQIKYEGVDLKLNEVTTGDQTTIETPTKTGYTFLGWKMPGSSTTSYQPGDMFTIDNDSNQYLTLTAAWELDTPATPTISGGNTAVYNYANRTLTCSTTSTYITGTNIYYEFGYSASKTGTITWLGNPSTTKTYSVLKNAFIGTRYYSCRIYVSNGTDTTETIQTTAPTTKSFVNSRVYFDATTNEGTISGSVRLYTPYGMPNIYTGRTNQTAGTIPTATKEGYTFEGWYTTATDGNLVINPSKVVQASVSGWTDANKNWLRTSTTNNDTVNILYAHYSINSYSVTYNTTENGGTGTIANKTVNYGDSIDLTPPATKTGWTFVGWNTDKNATTALSELTMGTSNVTLYAIYRKEAITLTAKWNANNATLSSTADSSCTL